MKRLTLVLGAALWASLAFSAGAEDGSRSVGQGFQAAADRFVQDHPEVGFYKRGSRITRLYGSAFGFGADALDTAEQFRSRYAGVLGVAAEDLEPVSHLYDSRHTQPVMYDRRTGEPKFTLVYYSQYKQGLPVFRAELRLLVRNEGGYPLVLAAANLRDLGEFSVSTAEYNAQAGRRAAIDRIPSLINFTDPEVVIWAGVKEMEVVPAVALTFIADNYGPALASMPQRWLFVTEAATGKILYEENQIHVLDVGGRVQGFATEGVGADICEIDSLMSLPHARVNIGATVAYTDENGDFVIPNGGTSQVTVQSELRGQWVRVWNQEGAEAVRSKTVIPPGPANFIHNDPNEISSGEYTRAEVNGYLGTNVVRSFTLLYNPDYPNLQQNEFPVYVNEQPGVGYCPGNAWWDGVSTTFCQAGSGYPNMAFSSVVYHEYGHHLVGMAGSGQGAYGEGMGDVMSVLVLDDPRIGLGFFGSCTGSLRTADNDCQYLESGCSTCGSESHDCGRLLAGCVWSTRNELVITEPDNYIDVLANLAVNSILVHTGSSIDPSITIDYLTLDDDDGNLLNGTPHYPEINAGFGAHGMPGPELQSIQFVYPGGLPEMITPNEPAVFAVHVEPVAGIPVAGSGQLHYSVGGGPYVDVAMDEPVANEYLATLPAAACGSIYSWYVSAEAEGVGTMTDPADAPTSTYSSVSAVDTVVIFEDDFEADLGWTVQNEAGLIDGQWDRGVPVNCSYRGAPASDFDGSGQCYLTDNSEANQCNSDVDGGHTWLLSPTIDLSSGDAAIHYALWYRNNIGANPNTDFFNVHVSNNNGGDWVLAETFGPVTASGWTEHTFTVGDFVTPTSEVIVRFEASDLGSSSIVEAGVDAFEVSFFDCGVVPCPDPADGDMDGDGNTNGDDIRDFVDGILGNPPQDVACHGDFNGNTVLDLGDIDGMVSTLLAP